MKLIFVYNADSGMVNTVKDIGHKLFSPNTYDCFLCSLTHGTFRENPQWKEFRNSSAIDMVFLHRDEFEQRYDQKLEYPIILKDTGNLTTFMSREELAGLASLDQLIQKVSSFAASST